MRREDELYIELNLSKILELYIEADCSIDKLGNMVFKNKNKVKEKINKEISDLAEELDVLEDEIRDYLINIYRNKCINQNYIKEGMELISILKEAEEENKEEKSKDSNKNTDEKAIR